jgi:pyruvate kinase
MFNDGKIEGVIREVNPDALRVEITSARDAGSKLRADKGINLPKSHLSIDLLTRKDQNDLDFVCEHADAVNISFINSAADIRSLLRELDRRKAKVGIILKIETRNGFRNLPRILLTAMQRYPVGVMVARGDLAIEAGWKNFASIQEEIVRICEAAHVPDIWATQVLENLAKKGTPTRAEITDAAVAQRAECVMLNKGFYLEKAVVMLDKILRRMQFFRERQEVMLPVLDGADELRLSHRKYDIGD